MFLFDCGTGYFSLHGPALPQCRQARVATGLFLFDCGTGYFSLHGPHCHDVVRRELPQVFHSSFGNPCGQVTCR